MRVLLAIALWLAALPVAAEEVVAALSQNRISINANFDGSEILVFGAVKREKPLPPDDPLDVIIAIEGPLKVEIIRKKERRLGIWVNVDATVIGHTPTYYAVASTRALDEILPRHMDSLYGISIDARIVPALKSDPARDALIALRRDDGVYSSDEGAVQFAAQTLFNASFALPANLTEGGYTTRIFLLRGGRVIDSYETSINVQKVGIEQWLFRLAHEQALIYGLLCVVLAALAGWIASETFRRFGR